MLKDSEIEERVKLRGVIKSGSAAIQIGVPSKSDGQCEVVRLEFPISVRFWAEILDDGRLSLRGSRRAELNRLFLFHQVRRARLASLTRKARSGVGRAQSVDRDQP